MYEVCFLYLSYLDDASSCGAFKEKLSVLSPDPIGKTLTTVQELRSTTYFLMKRYTATMTAFSYCQA